MINLLPPAERQRMKKEYKRRVIVLYTFFASVALFIGIVLLLPSYFLANAIENNAEVEIGALRNSSESSTRAEINEKLNVTKERLAAITETETRINFYEVVDAIALYAENSIEISSMAYTRAVGEENSVLQLGGSAATRDDLLQFKQTLESDELFSEVILPVSSLAKDQDIEFNIEVKGKF